MPDLSFERFSKVVWFIFAAHSTFNFVYKLSTSSALHTQLLEEVWLTNNTASTAGKGW